MECRQSRAEQLVSWPGKITYQNVQADAQRGLEVNRAWNVARVELNSWFHGQVKISCILKIQQDMRFSRLTNSCTDVN